MIITSRKELIARAARLFAHKPALIYGEQTLTFREVDERANRLANALYALGLRPHDPVATLMANCLEYPEIEFALVKGSFPQVSLNPRLTPAEQLFQIDGSGARAVIVQGHHAPLVAAVRSDLRKVRHFICFDGAAPDMLAYEDLLSAASAEEPEGELAPDDVGEIRYSSGTSGKPKGIMLPYISKLAITRNLLTDHLGGLTSNDVFLPLQPLYHGAGWFILPVWLKGLTHVIVPRFDAAVAFDAIERHGVTVIKTVPTVLIRLLDSPDIRSRKLGTVNTIIYGGSPMPVERLKEALGVFGPVFVNLYGQTEAPMTITWLAKHEHTPDRLGSVGRPCTFVPVRIVDDDDKAVAPGEMGEVVVKADHQMIGYLDRPDATAATIKDGWLHTGDLGRADDAGYIYLSGGRKSEMIISGGLNVYPAEVEQAIYEHPAVAEVAAIGVPDPVWVESVRACVVVKEGHRLTEEELMEFCRERLAGYKRPKTVAFLKELPHNAAGKVLYGELRKAYREAQSREKGAAGRTGQTGSGSE